MKILTQTGLIILFIIALAASHFTVYKFTQSAMAMHSSDHSQMMQEMDMDEHAHAFTQHKEHIQEVMRDQGDYRCCLEQPCTYCIEKSPGHGEGTSCDCLSDIVNGVHPCGECIGEILEGHGSPYLTEYFAPAIAEEVGMQYLETLEQIIQEKYENQ